MTRVVVPCSDWALSGVNTMVEAVGEELVRRGWQVEILFTYGRRHVEASAATGMPDLPFRFLEDGHPRVKRLWRRLAEELSREEATIVLSAYDFVANGVGSALPSSVGFVLWTQADDGDYYEQAYRLGRYANAVVCVSETIRERVAELNPLIGERAVVIHNTSVRAAELEGKRSPREERIRLVYTGRLVQYQKRILDFVPLADALAASGVDFQIDLIGEFAVDDLALPDFEQAAARHLAAGTIRLRGRLTRDTVLEELRAADMFVLLSDFEGLPLSLVEALATGCVPIVGNLQSGIPELVQHGHNGLIQLGRDYTTWADAIIELHQDRDRLDRLSANAQQTIGEAYTVERIGDQFHQLLRRISTEIQDESYRRPPALTWGGKRAVYGDVLPPPLLYAPDERPWVAVAKPLWRALPTPVRDRLRRIAGSA